MKKITFILLIIILVISPSFSESKFTDVSDDKWYSEWVGIIQELEITTGYPDGSYRPDNQLKRIELLSFTMRSLNYDIPISEDYWGQNIIDEAVKANIISDESSDLMYSDPEGFITRQETARVVYNAYLKDNSKYTSEIDEQVRHMIKDINDIDDMYLSGVIGVFASGIVDGYEDKTFRPKNQLTRAEASVFITRLVLSEKRKIVDFDLNKFVYETSSVAEGTKNFTTYYSDEHQDIFNILTIIHTIVNEDQTDGFAEIKDVSEGSFYNVWLFTNLFDHDYSGAYRSNYSSWNIEVKKIVNAKSLLIDDYIIINSWNNQGKESQHYDVIESIFNYLFEDETEILWSKYFELAENPTDDLIDYTATINDRFVQIQCDSIGISLTTSRKLEVSPVNVEEVKVD